MKYLLLISILLNILTFSVIFESSNSEDHYQEMLLYRSKINEEIRIENKTLKERVPIEKKPIAEIIEEEIRKQADVYGVNPETAVRIAKCESSLNPFAENNHSSATGLYQFLKGTWDGYCTGDRLNYKDNIACFVRQFIKHPEWWLECYNPLTF